MSDLVKQLRSEAANWAGDLLDDAADRIETLEAEVKKWHSAYVAARDLARAALAPEQDK